MTSSGDWSKGPGTRKIRRARNCPTRRDPCGRMSRPEKSLQATEKAQNELGHDRSGPVGGRGPRPSPATGSATRPSAASPRSRRLGRCDRPDNLPQGSENIESAPGHLRSVIPRRPEGEAAIQKNSRAPEVLLDRHVAKARREIGVFRRLPWSRDDGVGLVGPGQRPGPTPRRPKAGGLGAARARKTGCKRLKTLILRPGICGPSSRGAWRASRRCIERPNALNILQHPRA